MAATGRIDGRSLPYVEPEYYRTAILRLAIDCRVREAVTPKFARLDLDGFSYTAPTGDATTPDDSGDPTPAAADSLDFSAVENSGYFTTTLDDWVM